MNLGVTDVFSNQADLSGITGNPKVKVSKVSLSAETTICRFLNSLTLSSNLKFFLLLGLADTLK